MSGVDFAIIILHNPHLLHYNGRSSLGTFYKMLSPKNEWTRNNTVLETIVNQNHVDIKLKHKLSSQTDSECTEKSVNLGKSSGAF